MLEAAKAALQKAGFTIENLHNRIKELEAENAKLKEPKKRVKQQKDFVKCDYKAARRDDGNCSSLCTVSHQFFWNSERKVCQIKDEFRNLLKAP